MITGDRVYPIHHPTALRRTPLHDRADLGTVIEVTETRLVIEWDTGEVDECDSATRRDTCHPWTVALAGRLP